MEYKIITNYLNQAEAEMNDVAKEGFRFLSSTPYGSSSIIIIMQKGSDDLLTEG